MANKSNLIMFPGGGHKTEAEKLLNQFCDTCLIFDREEQMRQFQLVRNKIFAYVSYEKKSRGEMK